MTCASCVARVERALAAVPGVVSTQVNLARETASLRYHAGQVAPADLIAASTAAGYPATVIRRTDEDPGQRKGREAGTLARMTWLAAGLTLPVFIIEMGGHLIPALHHLVMTTIGTQASWVLQFILTGLAVLTVALWLAFGPSPTLAHALVAGVSVLIIACPCAMGLATPTSIMVGTGRAAELGVLFRKGDALQALQAVKVVALDKTGTLTLGRPELTDLIVQPGFDAARVFALLAGAEAQSEHPVAHAILRAAQARGLAVLQASDFAAIPGYGLRATVAAQFILAGADRLMRREGMILPADDPAVALAEQGRTPLYLAIDGQLAAIVGVADPVKPATPAAIAALLAQGLRVVMITGDNKLTAAKIGTELGISDVVAEVLPAGEVAALNNLRQFGPVAFVGDGINDAPALAAADVGIAIGTGTDVAIDSADVVLMAGDLTAVVNAFAISRATMRNIRQNLFWAFGYNVVLIPVAAGVLYPGFGLLLSPALAAGAMALSSVFVLTNALRLRRVQPVKGVLA